MTELQVEIESGGDRIRAELFADARPRPGVVVIHDGRGYGEHAVGVAQELATAGYSALAVDLFSRKAPPADCSNAELLAFLRSLPDRQIVGDLQAAVDFLAADSSVQGLPIGMIGYCWGGSCTFLAAGHCQGLSAGVSWYGELKTEELGARHPEHPMDALDARSCPVLAMFAELDAYVPVAHVAELRERSPHPPDLEVVVYPDRHHGFAHRGRDHFDPVAHDDGWQRIWKLFAARLRAG